MPTILQKIEEIIPKKRDISSKTNLQELTVNEIIFANGWDAGRQDFLEAMPKVLEVIREEIEKLECPEKCNCGHIFLGYSGEFGNEENWDSCPVCVKNDSYNKIIKLDDIIQLLTK